MAHPLEYRHIAVRPIAGALGAEIEGVNLAQPLAEETAAEIKRAFLEYLVVFFREQVLSPPDLLTFAATFGKPMEYPQVKGLPECPQVTSVTKLAHETINFGGAWHSDTSYLPCPPWQACSTPSRFHPKEATRCSPISTQLTKPSRLDSKLRLMASSASTAR